LGTEGFGLIRFGEDVIEEAEKMVSKESMKRAILYFKDGPSNECVSNIFKTPQP
jgi:hypothetical protein